MTRESKLALVLGFSLMLFVLILVSDHMAARNTPVVATNTTERNDMGVPPLPGPGHGSGIIVQTGEGTQRIEDPQRALVQGGGTTPSAGGTPGSTNGGGNEIVARLPHDGPGAGSTPTLPTTPSVKTYTIKKGDTFAAIAAAEYKKRVLGDKLAAFNGMKPSKLRIGDTIKLPSLDELDPTAAANQPRVAQGAGEAEKAPERTASSEPTFRTYKVKEGDTLYRIAEREMGTANRWKELRSANPDVLKGGSDLHPGMQIKIPEQRLTSASTDA